MGQELEAALHAAYGREGEALAAQAERYHRDLALFGERYGPGQVTIVRAPGRVNLIGEHTDYNGGFSLPFALPHRTFVALARRDDEFVRLVSDLGAGEPWTGSLDDLGPGRAAGWIAYAGGPAWVLRDEGLPVGGFDAAIASFERALERSPRYGEALLGLAEAWKEKRDKRKAIDYYRRYIDAVPNGPEVGVARSNIERLSQP